MSNVVQLRPRERADWKRYGSPAAYLYPLIDVPQGITVRGHLATLRTVRGYGCQVEIAGERKTACYPGGKPYKIMREVKPGEIEEVRHER